VIDRVAAMVVKLIRNIPRVQVLLLSLAERHHCSTWPWPLDAQRTSPVSNVWHATWADGARSGMSFSSFDCHCHPGAQLLPTNRTFLIPGLARQSTESKCCSSLHCQVGRQE
jgi:hypothetical protein